MSRRFLRTVWRFHQKPVDIQTRTEEVVAGLRVSLKTMRDYQGMTCGPSPWTVSNGMIATSVTTDVSVLASGSSTIEAASGRTRNDRRRAAGSTVFGGSNAAAILLPFKKKLNSCFPPDSTLEANFSRTR